MVKKSSVDDVLPLSPMQEGMFFHALFDEHAPDVYTGQLILDLDGPLDGARLRRAAESLLARHANLRAEFRTVKSGKAVQVLRREVRLPWRDVDLSGLGTERADAEFERLTAADRAEQFDPARPPLVRFTLVKREEKRHHLVVASHHLLWDGWSAPILVRELFALYSSGGDDGALPRVRPYRDYLTWLSTQDREAAEDAWRASLAELDAPTLLAPAAAQRSPEVPERITTELPDQTTEALSAVARTHGLTVSTVLQGLWALLLSKMTGRDDVVLGATVSGRPAELSGVESMVGLFINTLPVRARLRPAEPVVDFLRRLQAEQAGLLDHQHLGLADIQRISGHSALFDTLIVLETYPIDEDGISQALGQDGPRLSGIRAHDATHYPLTLIALPGERLSLTFGYQPAVLDPGTVTEIAGWLANLVRTFVSEPARSVGRVDIVSPSELDELAASGNDNATEFGQTSVREMFEAQARRTPEAAAVVFGETTVSYAELDARADRRADALVRRGAGPESVVAVALPRTPELVVSLLAVLKAGAAYLPIDVTYPRERIDLMLTDAAPRLVICDEDFAAAAELDAARIFALSGETAEDLAQQERPGLSPDHPAYVVFTSGSTGRPKGVVGTQRALVNRLGWARDALSGSDEPGAVRVSKSPVSFIDGTTELLTGLVGGETVVLADDDTAADPLALAELVDQRQVDLVTLVPSLLSTLVDTAPQDSLKSVTTWITSGEALSGALAAAVADRWPAARLVNFYGCSEAAGDSLAHTVADDTEGGGPIAIGRPIANTQAYVLDRFLRPVPDGISGELYLAGFGLARGYLDQPGRTAERFVANPFGPPGSRLYRTGDLVRKRPDGAVEFQGRIDDQVKIRGFRVEPAEVEAILVEQPGVRSAAVVAHEEESGEGRLVGYVVPEPQAELDPIALRRDLAARLPGHLVPSAVVTLDALPRTPGGKLDRRALPAPDFAGLTTSGTPRTEREKLLCDLFAEVLGLDRVGVHDNFFDLGGNSVVSVRLVSRARREGLSLSPRDVFVSETVAELARVAGDGEEAPAEFAAEDKPLVSLGPGQLDKVLARWQK